MSLNENDYANVRKYTKKTSCILVIPTTRHDSHDYRTARRKKEYR